MKGVWSDEKSLEDLRSSRQPFMLYKIVITCCVLHNMCRKSGYLSNDRNYIFFL